MRSTSTSLTLRVATVLTAVPVALVLAAGSASAAPKVDGPAAERAASATAPQVQRPAVAKATKPATVAKRTAAAKPTKAAAPRRAVASPDLSQPQPLSKADRNGTGANPGEVCDHSYCSTRDGSPSRNGNGDGLASGRPCAGCVGKADNKNPKGQAVDGTDANNGYECDGNSGIARTNPAHTGCTAPVEVVSVTSSPETTCASGAAMPADGDCTPAPTCPSGAPMPADGDCTPALGGTTLQAAGRPVFGPPTGLAANTGLAPTAVARTLAPADNVRILAQGAVAPTLLPDSAVSPGTLPFTGTDAAWLAQLAALLLLVGTALVLAGRRARTVR